MRGFFMPFTKAFTKIYISIYQPKMNIYFKQLTEKTDKLGEAPVFLFFYYNKYFFTLAFFKWVFTLFFSL